VSTSYCNHGRCKCRFSWFPPEKRMPGFAMLSCSFSFSVSSVMSTWYTVPKIQEDVGTSCCWNYAILENPMT
jgi:hypothetical protein